MRLIVNFESGRKSGDEKILNFLNDEIFLRTALLLDVPKWREINYISKLIFIRSENAVQKNI